MPWRRRPATESFTDGDDGTLTGDDLWTYTWDAERESLFRFKRSSPHLTHNGVSIEWKEIAEADRAWLKGFLRQ